MNQTALIKDYGYDLIEVERETAEFIIGPKWIGDCFAEWTRKRYPKRLVMARGVSVEQYYETELLWRRQRDETWELAERQRATMKGLIDSFVKFSGTEVKS